MVYEFLDEKDNVDGRKEALTSEFMLFFVGWTGGPANAGYRYHVVFVVFRENVAAIEMDGVALYNLCEYDDSPVLLMFLGRPVIKVAQGIGFIGKGDFSVAIS